MKLTPENTALIIIDVQTRLLPVIDQNELLIHQIERMVRGANALKIPVLVTEQYPEGLGATATAISDLIQPFEPIVKMTFSCCGEEQFMAAVGRLQRSQLLVAGIEAHICVWQTCQDLLARGFEVHLLTDGIGSRDPANKQLAIDNVCARGGRLTGVEMALFELLQTAATPVFRTISRIIK